MQIDENGSSTAAGVQARDPRLTNGAVLVTLVPVSGSLPFPVYDVRKVPRAILSRELTITVEDYVAAVEQLTTDFYFRLYCICHQRVVCGWLIASLLFMALLILTFGIRGMALFVFSICWTVVICLGVAVSMLLNKTLSKRIARLVSSVNRTLTQFDLLLCVDDQGKFVCNRVVIVLLRFCIKDCQARIGNLISGPCRVLDAGQLELPAAECNVTVTMDTEELDRIQQQALTLLLDFSQEYCRDLVRGIIYFPPGSTLEHRHFLTPLHCRYAQCVCQYVERNHFLRKTNSILPILYHG